MTKWQARIRTWLQKQLGVFGHGEDLQTMKNRIMQLEQENAKLTKLLTNQLTMGVDADYCLRDSQSVIIVISRLKEGQVRIIPCKFSSLVELSEFTKFIQSEYAPKQLDVVWDLPPGRRPKGMF